MTTMGIGYDRVEAEELRAAARREQDRWRVDAIIMARQQIAELEVSARRLVNELRIGTDTQRSLRRLARNMADAADLERVVASLEAIELR